MPIGSWHRRARATTVLAPRCPAGTNRMSAKASGGEPCRLARRCVNLGLAATLAAPAFSGALRGAAGRYDWRRYGACLVKAGRPRSCKYALDGREDRAGPHQRSGGVLGKPVELVTEDVISRVIRATVVSAFSKLAGCRLDIVAFLGPVLSTQTSRDGPRYPGRRASRSASAAPTPR